MSSIRMNLNGKLSVPDIVTIPYIAGDGVGKEISPVMIQVVDAAVLKAYDGTRKIEWLKLLAGQEAFDQTGNGYQKKPCRLLRLI